MGRLFHRSVRVSIGLAALAAGTAALAQGPSARQYYGRWTISEHRPVFTARGKLYKTIDVAPCGRDFCGVSVADGGACGPTLFRFRTNRPDDEDTLHGHGRWGTGRKNITVYTYDHPEQAGVKMMELALGDGYDFSERSDNMPKFRGDYRRSGAARCTTS